MTSFERLHGSGAGFLCWFTVLVIVAGLAVRIAVGALLTFSDDVQSWALTISNIEAGGGLYGLAGYNYTPVWGYILAFIDLVLEPFGVSDFGERVLEVLAVEDGDAVAYTIVPTVAFALMVKVALYVCDLALAYLTWRLVMDRTGDRRKSNWAFALVFLCTVTIVSSGVIGMFDNIGATLTLLAVMLVMKDRCALGGMCFAAAALLKIFPAFLFFVLVGYVLRRHREDGTGPRRVAAAAVGALAVVAVVLLPSALEGDLGSVFTMFTSRAGSMGGDYGEVISVLTIAAYAGILVVSAYFGRCVHRSDYEDLDGHFLTMCALTLAVLFMFPSNPQYLVLLVPFLVVQMQTEDARYRVPYALISVGAPLMAVNRGGVYLFSLGAFTGLIDIGTVTSFTEWCNTAVLGGLTPMDLMTGFWFVEFAGIVLILLTRRRIMKESGTWRAPENGHRTGN